MKRRKVKSAKDILLSHDFLEEKKKNLKYVTREFQDFGYRLAIKLGDLAHKALYIKLAKSEDRRLLEEAVSFSMDYPKARNKGKIFMWKLKELKKEWDEKQKNNY
ncbi:hypothetical protein JW796_04050 [Candidatus Dojkabacteria bacterium]|nr:hypothetical protein [Candidatus Dojkabacteria bacterium]